MSHYFNDTRLAITIIMPRGARGAKTGRRKSSAFVLGPDRRAKGISILRRGWFAWIRQSVMLFVGPMQQYSRESCFISD